MRARLLGNYELKTVRQIDLESFAPQAARNRFGHMFPDLASDHNSCCRSRRQRSRELEIVLAISRERSLGPGRPETRRRRRRS